MSFIRNLFTGSKPDLEREQRVYDAIVAQARHPWFYADLAVPDTVAGRFDMIALHAYLLFDRFSSEGEDARVFSQNVHDLLFADMDRSLREMGVGDLSVGKRIRKMAQVLYGRSQAYKQALSQPDGERQSVLKAALQRNIYDGGSVPEQHLDDLAQYVVDAASLIRSADVSSIMTGAILFPAAKQRSAAGDDR